MPLFLPSVTPNAPTPELNARTIIVTGPTAGLGLETCRQLMKLGCETLVLACRDVSKGLQVSERLLSETTGKQSQNQRPPSVKVMRLDLADFGSVQSFASRVKSEVPVVDTLILNAGVGFVGDLQFTTDGHEITFQTNYLSNVLLVLELLPHMYKSSRESGITGRITWLGSRSADKSRLGLKILLGESSIFAYMNSPTQYSVKDRYADTKLLCQAFIYMLAERLALPGLPLIDNASEVDDDSSNLFSVCDEDPPASVIINMVCPGLVETNFCYKHLHLWARLFVLLLLFLAARSVEEGGWIIVYAAAVAGDNSHGQFLLDKDIKPKPASLESADGKQFQHLVWKETMMEMRKLRNCTGF
ncbi:hypothetical protein AJ79_03773 [Helicocarpus griseus UAMH5409]|uniref:Ketoreductase (KR) domain-containing protein n=1 Tax=Helicocarpus griseus UAMH5409 TaxID=1447875 RepID=A0A2B7XW83_9EURO|nr:hypothetical protein AJ79_03773 [Helicocarpus griseus UAMH5409]